jgi:hypothetical protein
VISAASQLLDPVQVASTQLMLRLLASSGAAGGPVQTTDLYDIPVSERSAVSAALEHDVEARPSEKGL